MAKIQRTDYADVLYAHMQMLASDLAAIVHREYQFDATRRWRFDFAFRSARLAVEVDGGQWMAGGGRHNDDRDREKLNRAAMLGWRVLRYSPAMIKNNPSAVIDDIRKALQVTYDEEGGNDGEHTRDYDNHQQHLHRLRAAVRLIARHSRIPR